MPGGKSYRKETDHQIKNANSEARDNRRKLPTALKTIETPTERQQSPNQKGGANDGVENPELSFRFHRETDVVIAKCVGKEERKDNPGQIQYQYCESMFAGHGLRHFSASLLLG